MSWTYLVLPFCIDPGLKDEVNKRAFEKLKKETSSKVVAQPVGGVSVRDEGSYTQPSISRFNSSSVP